MIRYEETHLSAAFEAYPLVGESISPAGILLVKKMFDSSLGHSTPAVTETDWITFARGLIVGENAELRTSAIVKSRTESERLGVLSACQEKVESIMGAGEGYNLVDPGSKGISAFSALKTEDMWVTPFAERSTMLFASLPSDTLRIGFWKNDGYVLQKIPAYGINVHMVQGPNVRQMLKSFNEIAWVAPNEIEERDLPSAVKTKQTMGLVDASNVLTDSWTHEYRTQLHPSLVIEEEDVPSLFNPTSPLFLLQEGEVDFSATGYSAKALTQFMLGAMNRAEPEKKMVTEYTTEWFDDYTVISSTLESEAKILFVSSCGGTKPPATVSSLEITSDEEELAAA